MTTFNYHVKIIKGSPVLQTESFQDVFPSCGEVVITSRQFESFEQCEGHLSQLLAMLSATSTHVSEKNHVIVSRINPKMDTSGKVQPLSGETWDSHTIMRAYIADAEALKKSELLFNVVSAITTDANVSQLTAQPE